MARWPVWELHLLDAFLSIEPAEGSRIEAMLAQLTAIYVGAHQSQGSVAPSLEKFMIYRDAWKKANIEGVDGIDESEFSETDLSVLRALR